MKKELGIELGIYVICISLTSFLWEKPIILAFCCLFISILMIYKWHDKIDLVIYFVGFILCPLGELVVVYFGAWEYSKPLYLIPIWIPFLWGIAALLIKKLSETIVKMI